MARLRAGLLLTALLMAAPTSAQQPAPTRAPTPASTPASTNASSPAICSAGNWSAADIFAATAEASRLGTRPAPRQFPTEPLAKGAAGGEAFRMRLRDVPPGAAFLAAAKPSGADDYATAFATEIARTAAATDRTAAVELRVTVPLARNNWFDEGWQFVVAVCADEAVAGYGFTEIQVSPRNWSLIRSALLIALIYGLAVFAAWQCNASRLEEAWLAHIGFAGAPPPPGVGQTARRWRKLRWAADPLFVSQDAVGHGSLGRLQLLLFTLVVGFVVLNVWFGTGTIATLSDDILKLLGISVAGATLSRVIESNAGLSTRNRLWIVMRGVLNPNDNRLPQWRDILAADGEIDVTRVQAIVFTVVTLMALLTSGAGDLSTFTISDQIQYLLGLSQITYLAGKAIPAESVRRLNEAIDALTVAENATPFDAQRFAQTRTAVQSALREIFGTKVKDGLDTMPPGRPVA